MRLAGSVVLGTTLLLLARPSLAQPAADAPLPTTAPPAPPPPGLAQPEREPPAAPPSAFGSGEVETGDASELVGFRDGFFLRDRRDYFRLYPEALLEFDVNSSFGPGVGSLTPAQGAADLTTKFVLRRARFGLEGEVLRRWSFLFSAEFGSQPLSNTTGAAESSAAKAGQTPGPATASFAPVQAPTASASLADVWLDYRLCNCFSLMLGQFNAPIGIENRTLDAYTPLRERNLAIRGFVAPSGKDIGALAWGFFGPRVVSYELGVFSGDGQNRPNVDDRVDFMGRIFVRPLAAHADSDFARTLQVGLSTRLGERDSKDVGYDYPAITTGQGFALWRPTYSDSLGRTIHVIPSAAQTTFGGELRAEAYRMSFQAEGYYVDNQTREAVDGFQLTNTERLGAVRGAGWYAQISGWPVGDAYVRPEPGIYAPRQLDLHASEGRPRRGLELVGVFAGVNASYEGASRQGALDSAAPPSGIALYQLGLAAQYWHTKHVRVAVEYDLYDAPGSGSTKGTVVPDNIANNAGNPGTGHVLHELGLRVALSI